MTHRQRMPEPMTCSTSQPRKSAIEVPFIGRARILGLVQKHYLRCEERNRSGCHRANAIERQRDAAIATKEPTIGCSLIQQELKASFLPLRMKFMYRKAKVF